MNRRAAQAVGPRLEWRAPDALAGVSRGQSDEAQGQEREPGVHQDRPLRDQHEEEGPEDREGAELQGDATADRQPFSSVPQPVDASHEEPEPDHQRNDRPGQVGLLLVERGSQELSRR